MEVQKKLTDKMIDERGSAIGLPKKGRHSGRCRACPTRVLAQLARKRLLLLLLPRLRCRKLLSVRLRNITAVNAAHRSLRRSGEGIIRRIDGEL